MLRVWNTQAENDIVTTIEYDVKSFQVKMTIVKCTNHKKRIETYLPTERDVGIANVYVTQSEKINKKQSRKRFKIWIAEMWVLDLK